MHRNNERSRGFTCGEVAHEQSRFCWTSYCRSLSHQSIYHPLWSYLQITRRYMICKFSGCELQIISPKGHHGGGYFNIWVQSSHSIQLIHWLQCSICRTLPYKKKIFIFSIIWDKLSFSNYKHFISLIPYISLPSPGINNHYIIFNITPPQPPIQEKNMKG